MVEFDYRICFYIRYFMFELSLMCVCVCAVCFRRMVGPGVVGFEEMKARFRQHRLCFQWLWVALSETTFSGIQQHCNRLRNLESLEVSFPIYKSSNQIISARTIYHSLLPSFIDICLDILHVHSDDRGANWRSGGAWEAVFIHWGGLDCLAFSMMMMMMMNVWLA